MVTASNIDQVTLTNLKRIGRVNVTAFDIVGNLSILLGIFSFIKLKG